MAAGIQQSNPPSKPSQSDVRQVTLPDFQAAKKPRARLTMLTAYDYTMARLLDAAVTSTPSSGNPAVSLGSLCCRVGRVFS
jgi:hypothetical protein